MTVPPPADSQQQRNDTGLEGDHRNAVQSGPDAAAKVTSLSDGPVAAAEVASDGPVAASDGPVAASSDVPFPLSPLMVDYSRKQQLVSFPLFDPTVLVCVLFRVVMERRVRSLSSTMADCFRHSSR
jgi:hypothetical protein